MTTASSFLRCFLLAGDRALARTLPRASVGMRSLSAHRQSTTMPHAAIAIDFHQALDIEAHVLAEVALDFVSVGNHLPNLPYVILGKILDADVLVDARLVEDVVRRRPSDAVDVCETNLHPLVQWKVDACDSCHFFLSLPLFVFWNDADDPDDALSPDDLAFAADSLDR